MQLNNYELQDKPWPIIRLFSFLMTIF